MRQDSADTQHNRWENASTDISLRQKAAPYHLATVKFPIDEVDPHWSDGSNRAINETHCQRLRKIFESRLERTDPTQWLRLACHKDDVEQMKKYLQCQGQLVVADGTQESWPDFMDWGQVIKRPAVLLAGNHRVKALQELLRRQGRDESERWWICDIYDRDRLPLELSVRLRANREEMLLPDSHGQVWNELVVLAQHKPHLFQGNAKDVEQQMGQHLGLNEYDKFPIKRLGTLWRNNQWRPMITEMCQSPFGQNLFNISTFEWLSSRRLDDLWFVPLRKLNQVLRTIHDQCEVDVTSNDWTKLAAVCPSDNVNPSMLADIFFPSSPEQQRSKSDGHTRPRRKGFFVRLNDEQYGSVHKALATIADLYFPDVSSWLKITKDEGKLISAVITHIGQWLHQQPYRVLDRSSLKPALRLDFIPALQETHGDNADIVSISLQREIAILVRKHASILTHASVKHWVDEYPHDHPDTYRDRFRHEAWSEMLKMVYDVVGPHFHGSVMQFFNHQPLPQPGRSNLTILPSVISHALSGLPELTDHATLGKPATLDDLMRRLEPVVAGWVTDHCSSTVKLPSLEDECEHHPTPPPELMPPSGCERNDGEMQRSMPTRRPGFPITSSPALPNDPLPESSFPSVSIPSDIVMPEPSSPGFEDVPRREVTTAAHHRPPALPRQDQVYRVKLPSSSRGVQKSTLTSTSMPRIGLSRRTPQSPMSHRRNQQRPFAPSKVTTTAQARQQDSQGAQQTGHSSLVPAKRKLGLSSGGRAWRNSPGVAPRS